MAAAIQNVVPSAVRAGTYNNLCTFAAPDQAFTPAGAPSGEYVPIVGLENLECMSSVPSMARIQATEVRALAEITASELHHVAIPGYYPQIDDGWRGDGVPPGQWVVIVGDNVGGVLTDGYQYQIMGVEFDSQNQMTRVQIKLGTV